MRLIGSAGGHEAAGVLGGGRWAAVRWASRGGAVAEGVTPVLPLTTLYAAPLRALHVAMAVRVIGRRRAAGIAIGVEGDRIPGRPARAHGNCATYVPLGSLRLAVAEMDGAAGVTMHLAGGAPVSRRVLHALGASRKPERRALRRAGMARTFFAPIAGAVAARGPRSPLTMLPG